MGGDLSIDARAWARSDNFSHNRLSLHVNFYRFENPSGKCSICAKSGPCQIKPSYLNIILEGNLELRHI